MGDRLKRFFESRRMLLVEVTYLIGIVPTYRGGGPAI
jgi:hypothetical protein